MIESPKFLGFINANILQSHIEDEGRNRVLYTGRVGTDSSLSIKQGSVKSKNNAEHANKELVNLGSPKSSSKYISG